MNLKNKNVLVMGLGISGISTIKVLFDLGARIFINDEKEEKDLKNILEEIKNIPVESYLGKRTLDLDKIDLIIKSPGIPPSNGIIIKAIEKNIKVINDIELGTKLSNSKNIIAITGTNGKTTTTTSTGEIFKSTGNRSFVGGNIGKSILKEMVDAKKEDVFILEMSSFQLEHTVDFKAKISLILNISPDHLDWHGNFENYKNAKKKIFANQGKNDYTILNYDDKILRTFENEINSEIIWFSVKNKIDRGIFLDGENIIINLKGENIKLLSIDKLLLKGEHNLENILGSVAIAYIMGIPLETIRATLIKFKGVEHRLEFVLKKNGRSFFNDSKGTNIDSSIKAINAIDKPIILIAGGYDKRIEFDKFILSFNGKVKHLILLGATSIKIRETALKLGFKEVSLVETMEEAVNLAYNISEKGDSILLSPACASWGMFRNFEERGKAFKEIIGRLGEEQNG